MKTTIFSGISSLLLLAFLAGCATPGTNRPGPGVLAKHSDASAADLAQGRAYCLRECGSCHRHYQPAERSPAAWGEILARKPGRVSLTSTQFQKLHTYIMAASRLAQQQSPSSGP